MDNSRQQLKKQVKTYEKYLKEDQIDLNKIDNMFEKKLTTKDRLIVEKAYETYAREFASIIADSEEILNSYEITILLSANNYQKDGPNFIKSKKYITDSIEKLNQNKDKISLMRTENEALQYIEGKTTKKYYKELYLDLALGLERKNLMHKSFIDSINEVIELLNDVNTVLDILKKHQGKWQIVDGQILFYSDVTLLEYEAATAKVKEKLE